MVSVSNVSGGQAATYYQKDDYYVGKDGTDTGGQWYGEGAKRLGLQGPIDRTDYENIIAGKDIDGNQLIAAGGERHDHRAGTDITFSAPKSVSIAGLVLRDERVIEAHNRAVTSTLDYIERHYAQARQTSNGVTERVNTGNLVIARFDHEVSRELDPQLHTHCVIMNMTQKENGDWRALSNEKIFEHKMYIGQYYRNELAANLKDIGYAIQSDSKGLFEIRGIDQKILDHFSRRSEQLKERAAELRQQGINANESKLKEMATLDSREAKRDVDLNVVKQQWDDRLRQQGYSKDDIQRSIRAEANREHGRAEMSERDYIRAATRALTEHESTFAKEDVLRVAGRLSLGEQRIEDLERAYSNLARSGEIKTLSARDNVYTTSEMLRIEARIVEHVRAGHGHADAIASREQVEAGIRAYEQERGIELTTGQEDAVRHILTSQDRYVGIQGDAGTGKTTMLSIVREQAEAQGYEVRGLAYTGKAAAEMQAQSGIESQTVDSFLASRGLMEMESKQVWVVDEASMLGSRKMDEVIRRAEQINAKVVFVGDVKQLQSVEAGKMFAKLQESGNLKTVQMADVQRQRDEAYRAVVRDLAAKRIERAMSRLEAKGRVSEIQDRATRLDKIVADYVGQRSHHDTIIVTARNADRNELNSKIRDELRAQGRIGSIEHAFTVRESKNLSASERHFAQSYSVGDIVIANKAGIIGRAGTEGRVVGVDHQRHVIVVQTKSGTKEIDLKKDGGGLSIYQERERAFAAGDKIVFLKNDRGVGVKNGQTALVKHIDENGKMTVKMWNGTEKDINIRTQYSHIGHGYAVTAYKSQGQTTQTVLYHADTQRGVNYNEAYVAITRGREDVRIYTDSRANLKEQMQIEQTKTSTLDYRRAPEKQGDKVIGEREDRGRGDEAAKGREDKERDRGSREDRAIGRSDREAARERGDEAAKERGDRDARGQGDRETGKRGDDKSKERGDDGGRGRGDEGSRGRGGEGRGR